MLPLLLSPEIFPSCRLEGEFCCGVNEVTNNVKEGEGVPLCRRKDWPILAHLTTS